MTTEHEWKFPALNITGIARVELAGRDTAKLIAEAGHVFLAIRGARGEYSDDDLKPTVGTICDRSHTIVYLIMCNGICHAVSKNVLEAHDPTPAPVKCGICGRVGDPSCS